MGRNAMSDEDKDRRRRAFLAAAHRLFRERRDLPPVAEIAVAAGLAKGTVYRYFKSKEEIFVALLEDDFGALFAALEPMLAKLPEDPGEAARVFARKFARSVLALEDLLPLASLSNGVLEQNLPAAVMRRFKTMLATGLRAAGKQIEARFAGLGRGRGTTLLLQTYALTLGLWQALDYPAALRKLLEEPALRPLDRRFSGELETAVRTLWLGSLPAKKP